MTLSLNKFANISKIPGMTNEKLMKASYEIIYKRNQQQSGQAVMTMESFFSGLEFISSNLYPDEDDQNTRTEMVIDHLLEHI